MTSAGRSAKSRLLSVGIISFLALASLAVSGTLPEHTLLLDSSLEPGQQTPRGQELQIFHGLE
jgi:hypothetical protein